MTDVDPQDEQVSPDEDPNLRQLRKKAKKADELAALEPENAELRKKLAIYEAGLTGLTARQIRALSREDDIDWSDSDSIKAAAEELGYGTTAVDKQQVPQEELDAQERIQKAGAGAGAAGWDPISEMNQLDPKDPEFDAKLEAISQKANDPIRL